MKTIFWGTPLLAVPSIQYLIQRSDVQILAVITQPDKKSGRGQCLTCSSVKCVAIEENIPLYQPVSIRKDTELIQTLKNLQPDFFVTFAFGQILSQEVLDIPKYGTINLHASLLPRYRGANPIQAPIVNGDRFTGITTMLTEIGVDTGKIILQKEIEIKENMESPELTSIISELSPSLIYESLVGLYNGKIIPVEQEHEKATHAPKISKNDGIIDWSESAKQIHNKVRAYKPWPSCFSYINGSCIKITETRLSHAGSDELTHLCHPELYLESAYNCKEKINSSHFGQVLGKIDNGIDVMTGDGVITITKVQPACKKEMDALSWYNGARLPKRAFFKSVCESEEECSFETACEIPLENQLKQ